jgi:hypothetical protein
MRVMEEEKELISRSFFFSRMGERRRDDVRQWCPWWR